MTIKLIGIALVAVGTAGLWFGGIPYRTNDTIVKLGPLEAKADVDRTLDIPKPVSAGLNGVGVVLLLVAGKRR